MTRTQWLQELRGVRFEEACGEGGGRDGSGIRQCPRRLCGGGEAFRRGRRCSCESIRMKRWREPRPEANALANPLREARELLVLGVRGAAEPGEKVLIRGLEQAFQKIELLVVQLVERPREKALEEQIELLHAPPAAPAQPCAPPLPGEAVPPM